MMIEPEKPKREPDLEAPAYQYNFIAPYDLETCTFMLRSIKANIKEPDYRSPYYYIYLELKVVAPNVQDFEIIKRTLHFDPLPIITTGQLRFWTSDSTLISFKPEIDVPCFTLLVIASTIVFGCFWFYSSLQEKWYGSVLLSGLFLLGILIYLVYSYITNQQEAVNLVKRTFNLSDKALHQDELYFYFDEP